MDLTVVIPVYNGEKSIVRCLDSLLAQTYRDYKILIINDGSTDDSSDIISAYSEAHPSIVIHMVSRSNRGVAQARNYGIEQTDTKYITFVDQDDSVAPDYLQAYIEVMQDSGADIVCGGYQRYNAEKKRTIRTVSLTPDPWAKFVVVAPWAHMYRTAFLKENDLHFLDTSIGEDVYFSILAYAYTSKIAIISHTGYYWIDNPVSVSNKRQRSVNKNVDPFILLNALHADMPEDNRIERQYLEYYLFRYIVWYLLFTVRSSSKAQVETQYHRLIQWLKEHYPDFENNPMISLLGPKGEPFNIRVSVWVFTRLYKAHMILPCLKLLSRPNE